MNLRLKIDPSYVELYERLGGAPVLTRVVGAFHRALLGDARLQPFFAGADSQRLLERQQSFFAMVFGGPNTYEGLDMRRAHAPARAKGLTDDHLEIAIGHFRDALAAEHLAPALITEALTYLHSMRDDILSR